MIFFFRLCSLVAFLISLPSIMALSVDSRTFFNCYDSAGWCKADCSLPCFSVDHCNGSFQAMYTCPSIGLLILFVLAIVLILLFFICCITVCCCCCPCCPCAKSLEQRRARRRKEALLSTDVRHYERNGRDNDGYGNYPTARIVEVSRKPISNYDEVEKTTTTTSRGTKKQRQKSDIVHLHQRKFDDSDIIDGFEHNPSSEVKVWETSHHRRTNRDVLPLHNLQYEESYRNGYYHDYPIVPEPDYPTNDRDQVEIRVPTTQRPTKQRAELVTVSRRHNDNASSLYRIQGTQTSQANISDYNNEGELQRGNSNRLSI